MTNEERIKMLEMKVTLLETQLELERLINTPTERITYPQYPEPIYPWYPKYPYGDGTYYTGSCCR